MISDTFANLRGCHSNYRPLNEEKKGTLEVKLTYPELERDVLRLDLHRPLVGRLLLQVDVLDDPEDVVGVDHVLGRAARTPRRRLRGEVRLLVAPRQGRPVHGGVILYEGVA